MSTAAVLQSTMQRDFHITSITITNRNTSSITNTTTTNTSATITTHTIGSLAVTNCKRSKRQPANG
jgi:hypothetical protein